MAYQKMHIEKSGNNVDDHFMEFARTYKQKTYKNGFTILKNEYAFGMLPFLRYQHSKGKFNCFKNLICNYVNNKGPLVNNRLMFEDENHKKFKKF